jgi:diacylglycerol kinase (ATP)
MVETHKSVRHRGVERLLKAFTYSWDGILSAIACEEAFRQELCGLVVVLPAACLLPHLELHFRLELVAAALLLLVVELLNSALEAIVDKASPEIHPLAKRAKDMGSAAVLFAVLINGVFWCGAIWMAFGGGKA